MSHISYFARQELACPETGIVKLAEGFAENLVQLRTTFNQPMIVTSCCRSASYNKSIGGNPRSLHVYDQPYHNTGGTCAIDISVTDGITRGKLISLAWNLGWSIGVHKNFLHLDRRGDYTNLPQMVFLY